MIPYARQKTWVNNTAQQVDAAWLNTVEDTLASGFGVTPATNGALVWDGAKFTAAALLKDAQIDPAAAIARSKLNFGSGLVNADIAAAAAIAPSKIGGGYAPNKITVSTLAGGPPGAPSDGDIWVATNVDGSGIRWQFQYNAGSASTYKWEFIGGPDLQLSNGTTVFTTAINTWMLAPSSVTIARAGDYHIRLWGHTNIDTTFNANVFMGVRWSGGTDFYLNSITLRTAGDEIQGAWDLGIEPLHTAGMTLTAMGQSSAKSAANYPAYYNLIIAVQPVRVI